MSELEQLRQEAEQLRNQIRVSMLQNTSGASFLVYRTHLLTDVDRNATWRCVVWCFWRPRGNTKQGADLDLWALAVQVLTFEKPGMCLQVFCFGRKP